MGLPSPFENGVFSHFLCLRPSTGFIQPFGAYQTLWSVLNFDGNIRTSLVVLIDPLLMAFGDSADPDIRTARWKSTPSEINVAVITAQFLLAAELSGLRRQIFRVVSFRLSVSSFISFLFIVFSDYREKVTSWENILPRKVDFPGKLTSWESWLPGKVDFLGKFTS